MIKKVIFFNLLHNGDLHVSRSFVKFIAGELINRNIEVEYQHKNTKIVLKDLGIPIKSVSEYVNNNNITHKNGDVLYINTWYNSDKDIFKKYGVSFDCLYYYFSKICQQYFDLDISKKDIWTLFPEIDYSKYNIKNIDNYINNLEKYKKKIFISNGRVLSGQCINFDWSEVINLLSAKYSDYIFFISNYDKNISNRQNIVFTKDIIKSREVCDLNENGYLSTKCDIMIGRYSGAYTFSMTATNYQRDMKYLVFCRYCMPTWFKKLDLKYKAKIFHSEETKAIKVFKEIDKVIQNGR